MGVLPLSLNVYDGLAIGFFTTIVIAFVLDKFGNVMFRKGVAKPFYVGAHRLHHRDFLFIVIPIVYAALAFLISTGVVHIVFRLLWTGLGATLAIAAACLAIDLALDYLSTTSFRWGILRHELVYLLIPAFAFSDFLRVVI